MILAPFVNVKRPTFENILQNFTNVRITVEQFTNSVCFEIGRGDLAPGRMVTVITQSGGTHKIWHGMVWHGMV